MMKREGRQRHQRFAPSIRLDDDARERRDSDGAHSKAHGYQSHRQAAVSNSNQLEVSAVSGANASYLQRARQPNRGLSVTRSRSRAWLAANRPTPNSTPPAKTTARVPNRSAKVPQIKPPTLPSPGIPGSTHSRHLLVKTPSSAATGCEHRQRRQCPHPNTCRNDSVGNDDPTVIQPQESASLQNKMAPVRLKTWYVNAAGRGLAQSPGRPAVGSQQPGRRS